LVLSKLSVLVLPNHQHTLNMTKELVAETSEKLSHPDVAVCPRKFPCPKIKKKKKKNVFRETGVVTNMSAEINLV
jgi:hypothetical protein